MYALGGATDVSRNGLPLMRATGGLSSAKESRRGLPLMRSPKGLSNTDVLCILLFANGELATLAGVPFKELSKGELR